ncbi:tripartite tricarboxylate transporter substrate binding protein [Priestia abyssalis]|uniref:tripartite tricarboxylate transporter substrate binding protein n=1 Tax=Priestia abyssalis TaxID=1221450 RepID=UPI0009952E0C|nr:tripartite tricarboxylate transporter substrate-binding protein [Priestia abyssalis]
MKKRTRWLWGLICVLTGMTAGCSYDEPQENQLKSDSKQIEFVAPNFVGGGWDLTARSMQSILNEENIVENPIVVSNKIGGGGEVGWKYVKQQQGNVLAVNSSLLITNHLLGRSQLTYEEFTPIAILATEWEVVVVSKNSSIRSAEELMNRLKKDAKMVKMGVSVKLGNDDHLSFVQASKAFGINPAELEFFVYRNSEDLVNALVNEQIGAAPMSFSEAEKYYQEGKVNILVVSSEKRLEGLKEVPTWKEQGIDLVFQHWRGVMGPADMTKEEVAYWDEVIYKMVVTDEWKEVLNTYSWSPFYKNSRQTELFLKQQSKMYEELMNDSGLKQ